MAVAQTHTIYAAQLDAALLGGITQQSHNLGSEVLGEASNGEVYRRHQSIAAIKPSASFTTRNIAAAITAIGMWGKSIATLTAGFSLFAQKMADGGTRAGATSHRKYNIKKGAIIPKTLSAGHRDNATIGYDVVITYDGTNGPVGITDLVSLPSGVPTEERFTIGPVTVGGIALTQLRSLEIDFGLKVDTESSDSDLYETAVNIKEIDPTITFRGINIEWLKSTNIPLTGQKATHLNTTFYLRKRDDGGTFVAPATAEHIKFTAAGIAHVENIFDARTGEIAETSLVLKPQGTVVSSAIVDPIIVDTASAIA